MNQQINHEAVFEVNLQHQMKQLLTATLAVHTEVILRLIEADPHQWSSRPCPTCRAISGIIDRPFGCVKKRENEE
jgi:hypothetical protein